MQEEMAITEEHLGFNMEIKYAENYLKYMKEMLIKNLNNVKQCSHWPSLVHK